MSRYVYEHPAEAGFGEHHASRTDPPLADRSAARHGAVGAPQHPVMPGEVSMAALDLAHGTEVTRVSEDPSHEESAARAEEETAAGCVVVHWTDSQGNPRATSVDPEFFGAHFRKVTT